MRSELMLCSLIGLFIILNINDAVVFKFTNIVCESYNKSFFVFNTCRLKAINRNKVILNLNATILHTVNIFTVRFKLFKKANGFKPWMVDRSIDVCRFTHTSYDPYFKIIYELYREFTNMNHTCPYVGHQILKGFYLRPELLRLPFPSGDYMLSLRWIFGKSESPTGDTNVSFSFVEDLRKE
ncbi:uncharacterized protein LOC113564894 [Drosophila persimilis]|uniref:uncharacterized protein LOC113564894 n=1 Tax=Drosophila persimilis TaxID=7234 RepID=UPI000F08E46D|nr:uncharacterized protein LOC113564894 [Drosophila persimilis]